MLLMSAESAVTRTAPSFHNPGHLRIWNESPLREFDPHILMIILGLILIAWIYYYYMFVVKKARLQEQLYIDSEEGKFQQLLTKKAMLLNKIVELEESLASGNIDKEEFDQKITAYKKHLVQVKLDLKKFTE
ncbi:hypothetical protein [Calidifontibacillus oryziterrae]|uniref:hypothetical protein n=1 Tax=Calidifontibacillus oryziterrae TaxID=1191699 RepID=UPI0002E91679|nr:hypothetical protein [Calidifontibacillus oryziterrae]